MARLFDGRSQILSAILSGLLFATFSVLLLPTTVLAHGLPPETEDIVVGPERVPAVMSTVGLIRAVDRTADPDVDESANRWAWSCRATLSLLGLEQAHVVRSEAGFIAATFSGILRSEDGCEWVDATGPVDRAITDIVVHPQNTRSLFAVTSAGGTANSVVVSHDAGLSWRTTGDPVGEVLFERIRVAPSDPQRIYLSGAIPSTDAHPVREVLSYRSDDGGITWREQPFDTLDGERNLFLLAVDDSDPDLLYARVSRHVDRMDVPERLVASSDGGDSWRTLFEIPGELSSFVIQGDSLFFGVPKPSEGSRSTEHGLWRSTDGGEHFQHIQDTLSVTCLRVFSGEIWACTSFFEDGFGIGRSADNGTTFEPVLALADLIGPLDCGEDHTLLCNSENEDLVDDYGLEICLQPPCGEPATGCSIEHNHSYFSWMLWFAAIVIIQRRRSRTS